MKAKARNGLYFFCMQVFSFSKTFYWKYYWDLKYVPNFSEGFSFTEQ